MVETRASITTAKTGLISERVQEAMNTVYTATGTPVVSLTQPSRMFPTAAYQTTAVITILPTRRVVSVNATTVQVQICMGFN